MICEGRRVPLRLPGRALEDGWALAVGDEIRFDPSRGLVEGVEPRRTELVRQRQGRPHVIAANMDQLAIIASFREPDFRPGVVDRFQLAALAGGLRPILVVNKLDRLEADTLPAAVREFEAVLPVFPVSARTGARLDGLRERLSGLRTILAGHSGVGKSTLLNALEPKLRLATAPVTAHRKGRHTTTRVSWIQLDEVTVVLDTPGVREIASGSVDPQLLDRVYPEIAKLARSCGFRNCGHREEPGCCVRDAVQRGELSAARLASYQRLRAEIGAPAR